MDELVRLRGEIDRMDDEIVRLINERARIAIEVGKVKKAAGSNAFYSPERERLIFERLGTNNPGPFPTDALKAVYREILSGALSLEKPLRVAYFGPETTYTHQAAIRAFGSSAEFLPMHGIRDVFMAVSRGDAEYGVVPVENSTEGVVTYTLDVFMESDLRISSELLLEINNNLLSVSGRIEDVKRVYSHPQPLAQCKEWLDRNLKDVPLIEVSSTAYASKRASEEPDSAAIAGEMAAQRHNLACVARRIQDIPDNSTRFLTISKNITHRTGHDKTSLLLSIKDRVGGLLNILSPFSRHGLNLSRIQSRPSKRRAWEYIFFIDLVGHVEDEQVTAALAEVEQECVFLKILGSYPSADSSADDLSS